MLALGDTAATLRLGDTLARRAYLGDTLVLGSPPLTMTVEGDTFAPMLELADGSTAEVTWLDETGTTVGTGTTPTIEWANAGPHTVLLEVSQPADVVTVNLGFHNGQDNGLYSLPSAYNYPTQPVTAITNLQALTGLQRFMAARTNGTSPDGSLYAGPLLAGHLDFSGMTTLEYVECFMADVESVDLAGCSSLVRLVTEQTNVTTLDLNPARDSLRDVRLAFQQGGSLTLEPLDGPLTGLYHFCTRRQALTGLPAMADLPAVRQLWLWNCGLVLPSLVVDSSQPLHSIILATTSPGGTPNQIAHLDLSGQTWADIAGEGPTRIEAFGIGMQTINLTGMGPATTILLQNNLLDEAGVDHVLTIVNGWGTSGGTLRLQGNAPPSTAGAAIVTTLQGRGWNVSVESTATLLWADEFDTDTSAAWLPGTGEADTSVAVSGGVLTWSGTNSYRRRWNAAGGTLPANVEVRLGFTLTTSGTGGPGSWWGVMTRFSGDSGVRVLFRSTSTLLRIGNSVNATDPTTGDTNVSGTLPVGWDAAGQHELALRSVGNEHTVYYDGVPIASRTAAGLPNVAGAGVGICGQPQGRSWDYIRVYGV